MQQPPKNVTKSVWCTTSGVIVAVGHHFNAILSAKCEKVEIAEDNEGRTAETRVQYQKGTHTPFAFCFWDPEILSIRKELMKARVKKGGQHALSLGHCLGDDMFVSCVWIFECFWQGVVSVATVALSPIKDGLQQQRQRCDGRRCTSITQ